MDEVDIKSKRVLSRIAMLVAFALPLGLIIAANAATFRADDLNNQTTAQYLNVQAGLKYTIYKPSYTAGVQQTKFQLLQCAGGGEQWLAVTFSNKKKTLQVYEESFDQHCFDAAVAKQLPDVQIGNVVAKAYVFCNPANQTVFNNCKAADVSKNGGYLTMTLPAVGTLKSTAVQIQGTGGIAYQQLVNVAQSMSAVSLSPSPTANVVYAWDCGKLTTRPTSLTIYCADAGKGISKLVWTTWGGSIASGTGEYYVNDCIPNCATGKTYTANVIVDLTHLERYSNSLVYTKMRFTSILPLTNKSSDTWDLIKKS